MFTASRFAASASSASPEGRLELPVSIVTSSYGRPTTSFFSWIFSAAAAKAAGPGAEDVLASVVHHRRTVPGGLPAFCLPLLFGLVLVVAGSG